MPTDLTAQLCTKCALCCDGSLFADVELADDAEADRLEALGLDAESDDADIRLMPLPCAALKGTRCGIYAHRPGTCRSFECRLLKDAQAGDVSVESALERIREARERVAQVKTLLVASGFTGGGLPLRERCAEALANAPGKGARAQRSYAALETAMGELDWLLERTFLARRKKGVGPPER
jgi:Fe-S-cluster containining protein